MKLLRFRIVWNGYLTIRSPDQFRELKRSLTALTFYLRSERPLSWGESTGRLRTIHCCVVWAFRFRRDLRWWSLESTTTTFGCRSPCSAWSVGDIKWRWHGLDDDFLSPGFNDDGPRTGPVYWRFGSEKNILGRHDAVRVPDGTDVCHLGAVGL